MRTVRPRTLLLACGILLFFLLPQAIFAQYRQFEGQKVTLVRFDPVDQPLDPDEIHRILPLKTGDPLDPDIVHASIERLFATGRYSDISVDAQSYQGGVAITFITKVSWFIGGVRATGKIDSPPGANQLANAGTLDLGQPYTDAKLQDALASVKRLMERNGLFRSQV